MTSLSQLIAKTTHLHIFTTSKSKSFKKMYFDLFEDVKSEYGGGVQKMGMVFRIWGWFSENLGTRGHIH